MNQPSPWGFCVRGIVVEPGFLPKQKTRDFKRLGGGFFQAVSLPKTGNLSERQRSRRGVVAGETKLRAAAQKQACATSSLRSRFMGPRRRRWKAWR